MRSCLIRSRFALLTVFALSFVPILSGGDAAAATLSWNNPSGGSAATASNWTPAAVPAAGDFLTFDLNNTYTTTFNSTTASSRQMRFRDGIVTLSFSSPHTNAEAIQLADTSQDTVTTKITNGTLNCNGAVTIAQISPAKGTLEVRDGNTIVSLAGASADLYVGTFGNGTLSVLAGGTVEVEDDVFVGRNSNAVGLLTVSGRDLTPLVPSNLITTGATGDIVVGWAGYGEVHVESFGTVFCGGNFYIAPEEHSFFDGNGLVSVGEVGGTNVATLTVDHDLSIGGGFGDVPGNATMNIFKNGKVFVNGTTRLGRTFVGNPDAILHIERPSLFDTGGLLRTGSLTLDEYATLDFDSGTIVIDGGTLDTDGLPLILNSDVATILLRPKFTLTNGATAALPDTGFPAPSLAVGTTGVAEVHADSGATLTLDADLVLGESTGSFGMLKLTNGGSLDASLQKVRAGIDGTGQIDMNSGGLLTCGTLEIGTDQNGVGVATVNGSGTLVTASNRVQVGANVFSADPVSILSLSNTAIVEAHGVNLALQVEDNARVSINSGSQFTAMTGFVWNEGLISLDFGFMNVDTLQVFPAGELRGNGFLAGDVRNDGLVAPGLSAGKLDLASTYHQTGTGKLAIELGNHAAGEWDTLSVAGPANLAGTLELTQLPTFAATSGSIFTILTCTSRTGTFTTVTLDGAPLSGSQFSLGYTATSVFLKAQNATDAPTSPSNPLALELVGRRAGSNAYFDLTLPAEAMARLAVYDVAGRELRVLRDAPTSAGRHRFEIGHGAARLASGVYFGRAIVTLPGEAPALRTARVAVVR